MTTAILITLCTLLLLAYFFDLTSKRTRIPSVILLLLMGWGLGQVLDILGFEFPDMSEVLPVLGTVGLILIVLEGALELEVNRSKMPLIRKAFSGSGLALLLMALATGALFHFLGNYPLKESIANAVPLAIISSAIAIPTARNLVDADREFVVYESSLSDILGVVFFNFMVLNEVIDAFAFLEFGLQLLLMAAVSLIASLGLAYLLKNIHHPVKFVPMILLIVLIYAVSKLYHLPSLLFILIFGLFLGNLEEIGKFRWAKKLVWEGWDVQVNRFHELGGEVAFLVRSLFFLLFGFTLQTQEILDTQSLGWSASLVGLIYGIRALQLRWSKLPLMPLLFIAPRGLITILLFLTIPAGQVLPVVNRSLLTQVILLTAGVMMVGMMGQKKATVSQPDSPHP
ncbi:MAG: cation:proton antiporter [Cyclobacteriaceae bacterium]|nr:cation:proton antiporter [Cyclobacteriaceae bacterium]